VLRGQTRRACKEKPYKALVGRDVMLRDVVAVNAFFTLVSRSLSAVLTRSTTLCQRVIKRFVERNAGCVA